MKHNYIYRIVIGVALVLGLLTSSVIAHEGREVGEALIDFGWRVEPAYTTLLNGVELTINHHETDDPIEELEETLTLEVSFGPSTKTLRLRPIMDEPGHYTADLIPMQPGDYSFLLTGTIGETEVDETFSSADGQFSTVEPIEDIQFP